MLQYFYNKAHLTNMQVLYQTTRCLATLTFLDFTLVTQELKSLHYYLQNQNPALKKISQYQIKELVKKDIL